MLESMGIDFWQDMKELRDFESIYKMKFNHCIGGTSYYIQNLKGLL